MPLDLFYFEGGDTHTNKNLTISVTAASLSLIVTYILFSYESVFAV